MADDKRVAKWQLQELLTTMNTHRNALGAYSKKGDASGVMRCELALKLDYSRIRKHCAEHDLELPHGVPFEDSE